MINTDSRYATGKVSKSYDPRSGSYQIGVSRVFPTRTNVYYTYTWVDGDRIDVIAQRLYGTSDRWHFIMDYNPEIIDAMNIAPGTQVRIPHV